MANRDYPAGASLKGVPVRVNPYESGSACYPGDFVTLASDGQVDPATAGSIILGVCLSYASASGQVILVADHPDQQVIVQSSSTHVAAQTNIGSTADILATAGSSVYKCSRHELDSSTLSTSATAQLRLIGIEGQVGDTFGDSVKCVCVINEHQFGPEAGDTGLGL